MQLISWNVHQLQVWDQFAVDGAMPALALLQEAPPPPPSPFLEEGTELAEVIPTGNPLWETAGCDRRPWRTAVVRLSPKISLEPIRLGDITADAQTLCVSRPGTVTAATVLRNGEALFNVASVYAAWERPLDGPSPIWADASAHRLLSDLTPLIWRRGLPIIISGDWTILSGHGEHGDHYYAQRYRTVFDRAEALGLAFIGPRHDRDGGRQAHPRPDELPEGSNCVPTYYRTGQVPSTATRQLDFVFASTSIADEVHARALNEPEEWGPSDHCRVLITVDI